MTSLKQAIQQQVEQHQLQEQELAALTALQEEVLAKPAKRPNKTVWAAAAAMATLALSLTLWFTSQSPPNLQKQIALDVVKNHLKLKPLDVKTDSMKSAQAFFTQLDFLPQNSSVLESMGVKNNQLLGGRYCSVLGNTAAQLRYQANDIVTLYQVAYDETAYGSQPDMALGEAPQKIIVNGVPVTSWREQGLLMVLVGGANSQ